MKNLVKDIACALVENTDAVETIEKDGEDIKVIELRVAEEDMGRVIGKQGRIAKSIRSIVKAASVKFDNKYTVEIVQK